MPSTRNRKIMEFYNKLAHCRDDWIKKNKFYYEQDCKYMRFLIPENSNVLELGCGTGHLLSQLKPARGVGVDYSSEMIAQANKKNLAGLEFVSLDIEHDGALDGLGKDFDFIILSDTIGFLSDCEAVLNNIRRICHAETRIIIAYCSKMWSVLFVLAERLRLKMPQVQQNWLSSQDIEHLLYLSKLTIIKKEWRILMPKRLWGIGAWINKYIATLPLIRKMSIRHYVVAKKSELTLPHQLSVSVLIPCKNEAGNIENAVRRLPDFGRDLEIIFVEGGSDDNTYDEILRVKKQYSHRNINVLKQSGKGKGNAVRTGFETAKGDILIILDADLTVPPEQIPKFYNAIVNGAGDFINGSRLVYPMEKQAMRFLNNIANRTFAKIFTWLLNQRITDTLCGTKVIRKHHYDKIVADRKYFGDFDPFGDFDLIFGAAKQNLKIVDLPIIYESRKIGETQISRFSHGWLLLKMVVFAYRKLKAL